MTRSARLSAALLLAALVHAAQPSEVWAENLAWNFDANRNENLELIRHLPARALSMHKDGDDFFGWIGFQCKPGDLVSSFRALASAAKIETKVLKDPNSIVRYQNTYPQGNYSVFWTVDNGLTEKSVWKPATWTELGGLELVGQRAFDLALDILRAEKQIEIKTPRGVIVNNLTQSKKAITELLKFCNS